jgi:hypothetical protein
MSKYGFKELIVWQKSKALAVEICAEIGRLLGALIKARGRFGSKLLMLMAGVAVGATFVFALL